MNFIKKRVMILISMAALSFSVQSAELGGKGGLSSEDMLRYCTVAQGYQTYKYAAPSNEWSDKALMELAQEDSGWINFMLADPQGHQLRVTKIITRSRLKNFIPSLTAAEKELLAEEAAKEMRGGNLKIQVEVRSQDFGYSFCHLTGMHISMLHDISERFVKSGRRPRVADLGAGHGFMSWKMIAVGGHLTAVEKILAVAKELQRNTLKAKPYLKGNVLKDICNLYTGDVFDNNLKVYQNRYDITYSGNLLHLFTPAQAQTYVKKLFEITNDGGRAYANVHTPDSSEIINLMLKKKSEGVMFPGHIIFEIRGYGDKSVIKNGEIVADDLNIKYIPIGLAPKDCLIQKRMEGAFNKDSRGAIEYFSNNTFAITIDHLAMMYFEEGSLRVLFENAGFIVEDVFYEYFGYKAATKLAPDMGRDGFKLSIIARKP